MDIINELKNKYKTGSIIFKLIIINVGIFIILGIINLIALFGLPGFSSREWFGVSADTGVLLYKPWTLITYMFVHDGFFHIFFNMLVLYWMGQIFLEFITPKRMLSVYLLGGISGAVFFILAFNFLPAFRPYLMGSNAVGASAAVYAVMIAVAAFVPDYEIGMLFIGRVKLKYLALAVVVIDLLSITGEGGQILSNAGGRVCHLGGASFGYLFAVRLKKGKDITKGFSIFMDWLFSLFKPGTKMKVSSNKYRTTTKQGYSTVNTKPAGDKEYKKQKADEQAEIDRILDKISKSGYESLSKEEKNTLFDQRKK
jgi:membrane associated rhomboid family serine protease